MAANFAEIFIKLGLKKEGFDKGIKSTKSSFKDMGKDLLKTGAMIGGVAAGAVLAGKAMFEMGKQGAAVIQTGESFEFLLEKVGAAPDLLDQLREATLGTVDDMTLMESTLTLTAGAGDDLSKMMMNAAPQLAQIAKAANKLNPALGDTAFMYQSIGTGVKRAQPLILDNLGLTIKVGDANEQFAKSIGKTVEELTAEEKSMAILNATLEAGDTLIAQVGGTVDAAGDSFAQMETKVANLTDQLKAGLAPAVSDVVDALIPAVETVADFVSVEALLQVALDNKIITLVEYKQQIRANMTGQLELAEAERWLTIKTIQHKDAVIELTGHERAHTEAVIELTGHERVYMEGLEDATKATDDAIEATDKYAGSMSDLGLAALGANDEIGGLAGVLGTELQKALKAATDSVFDLERMKFLLKLQTQDLTQEEKNLAIEQLAAIKRLEVLTGAVNDGTISHGEYQQALMDGKVTIEEFNTLMGITAGMADETDRKFQGVKKTLEELMGIDWLINIKIKTSGSIPDPKELERKIKTTTTTTTTTDKIPDWKERQHGGLVGKDNMYLVGERGPELFMPNTSGSIIPNNQLGSGGGRRISSSGNTYNYVRYGDRNIVTEPAQAAFLVEKQRQAQFDEIDKVI